MLFCKVQIRNAEFLVPKARVLGDLAVKLVILGQVPEVLVQLQLGEHVVLSRSKAQTGSACGVVTTLDHCEQADKLVSLGCAHNMSTQRVCGFRCECYCRHQREILDSSRPVGIVYAYF